MKILFLNPTIQRESDVPVNFLKNGVACLLPENVEDALEMMEFHGDTIDLAIIHREGMDGMREPGLGFIERLKSNSQYKDLPIILTTQVWKDADCASHQDSPLGVNAYLQAPYSEKDLVTICEAVLGQSFGLEGAAPPKTPPPLKPPPDFKGGPPEFRRPPEKPREQLETPATSSSSEPPVLELTTSLFRGEDLSRNTSTGIRIQLDGFGADAPPPPPEHPGEEAPEEPGAHPMSSEFVISDTGLTGSVMSTSGSQTQESGDFSEPPVEGTSTEDLGTPDFEPQVVLESPGPSRGQNPSGLDSEASAFDESSDDTRDDSGTFEIPSERELSVDSQVAEEMPYLMPDYAKKRRTPPADPSLLFAEALGDAVVPGGAAQAPRSRNF